MTTEQLKREIKKELTCMMTLNELKSDHILYNSNEIYEAISSFIKINKIDYLILQLEKKESDKFLNIDHLLTNISVYDKNGFHITFSIYLIL